MKNYTDHIRLETLHQQAQHYALLETVRNQDQSNFRQAVQTILEIAKHWTLGIQTPRVSSHV
jgi:DNA-binding FadR family transcriptional regulator